MTVTCTQVKLGNEDGICYANNFYDKRHDVILYRAPDETTEHEVTRECGIVLHGTYESGRTLTREHEHVTQDQKTNLSKVSETSSFSKS